MRIARLGILHRHILWKIIVRCFANQICFLTILEALVGYIYIITSDQGICRLKKMYKWKALLLTAFKWIK